MRTLSVPYADTNRSSALVLDHISGAAEVSRFSNYPPRREGLEQAARDRQFPDSSRHALCEAVAEQYKGLEVSGAVARNIRSLSDPNTLTITTGHQLCLFGGPLYVAFKILNVVRLASEMEKQLERAVVPIFWMATEDHDREEIDHTWINGNKVQWPGVAAGAVGRLPLAGITPVVEAAIAACGAGEHLDMVADLLRTSYQEHHDLTTATRRFVNGLYGHLGIVCVDGDSPALKRLFMPVMQEELLNQVGERTVRYADEQLGKKYRTQAHARPINLFYMRPGQRSRITLDEEGFTVLDGGPQFSAQGILDELQAHPERFSPNVLLRPVYQETILPNIAYVGGGGELAYWLQLRWTFQALQVPMPAILLRTSAGFISAKHMGQWSALGLEPKDLFADQELLRGTVAARKATFPTGMDTERAALDGLYHDLSIRIASADASLTGAVEARRASSLKGLDRLEKGLLRAAKREQATALDRMQNIHHAFFPHGGLQERSENVLPRIAAFGNDQLDELLACLDPLAKEFTIIVDPQSAGQ